MAYGTVKWFNEDGGLGLIAAADGGPDLLVEDNATASEELSEARISQIIAEGTDFYDRLFTPRSHNEQTAAADRARSIPSRAVTG